VHSELLVGYISKNVLAARTRVAINQQLGKFKGAKGLFGIDIVIGTRNKQTT